MEGKNYLEYQMACTEVLEVLKYMPKKDVEKIPNNVIKSSTSLLITLYVVINWSLRSLMTGRVIG